MHPSPNLATCALLLAANAPGRLSCLRVDPASLAMPPGATIPTGRFPREITVLPNGATAAVTVWGSRAIQMVPVGRWPA